MDVIEALNAKIAEYQARLHRKAVEDAVKRELTISGNLGVSAANVANVLHQAQQNAFNQNMQMGATAQVNLPHASMGSTGLDTDYGERMSGPLLADFKAKDRATWEFATATAQLLNAKIRAHYSPARSPHCTPRHEYIVWQLFNHNWMVDVQWVGSATGGSEEEWTRHFAKLADRISEARERGEKQYGDEPSSPSGLSPAALQQAQQMSGLLAQSGFANAASQVLAQGLGLENLLNQQGQQYASVAGQSQAGSAMGAGGNSPKAHAFRSFVGVGK